MKRPGRIFLMLILIGASIPSRADEPTGPKPDLALAEKYRQIFAEYEAEQAKLRDALAKATTRREQNEAYQKLSPDEATYSRRAVDLAVTMPKDPATRDALLWVINKPGRSDEGMYGDEFARAAALLVRYHGDDPEAVRAGLRLDNVLTSRRDALLLGFYAAAKGRESKGLARLALAQYLAKKAKWVEGSPKGQGRSKRVYVGVVGDDGKRYDKVVEQSDQEYAETLLYRQCDPLAIQAEADRLFEEVIADYADVPYITRKHREIEAMLGEPIPTRNGKPLTEEERDKLGEMITRRSTLGKIAESRLDELHNLVVGKPAPEIDGVDYDGKPLKLSDYRGKVVVLVFWGSWCGPCMREVPHERELVERLKGKPFALLGVDCNEPKEVGLKTIQAEKMTWPNWHDGADGNGPIVAKYHIRAFPTVMVLDPKGIIRSKSLIGSSLDKTVDGLLAEIEAKGSPK